MTLLISVLLTIYIAKYSFLEPSFPNVSAAEIVGPIGVYWNENCNQEVHSINWGILAPGETKRVVVYVRNEGNETCLLILTPENWNPDNASNYLDFSWNCDENRIEVSEIVKATLRLLVFPDIVGITDFSFDIIFEGRKRLLGDINGDGIVNMKDIYTVIHAYLSKPGDQTWNNDADLNKDSIINMQDLYLVIIDCRK